MGENFRDDADSQRRKLADEIAKEAENVSSFGDMLVTAAYHVFDRTVKPTVASWFKQGEARETFRDCGTRLMASKEDKAMFDAYEHC